MLLPVASLATLGKQATNAGVRRKAPERGQWQWHCETLTAVNIAGKVELLTHGEPLVWGGGGGGGGMGTCGLSWDMFLSWNGTVLLAMFR